MKIQTGLLSLFLPMLLLFSAFNFPAIILHDETSTFMVYGNCEMCKKRIETALLKNTNIKKANWDIKSKMLTVVYNPHLITLDAIHKLVADAGHDTDKIKANDAVYKSLPACCHYERKK